MIMVSLGTYTGEKEQREEEGKEEDMKVRSFLRGPMQEQHNALLWANDLGTCNSSDQLGAILSNTLSLSLASHHEPCITYHRGNGKVRRQTALLFR